MRGLRTIYIAILLSTFSLTLWAQDQSVNNHEKQIKLGNDRLNHQIDPLLQRQNVFLQESYTSLLQVTPVDEEADACFPIQKIVIEGNQLLHEDAVKRITNALENNCLGLQKINGLIGAISNLYLESGFVTSRAYIVPQDLSKGTLRIIVLEGVIEALKGDGLTQTQLQSAFPIELHEVLHLRDLEQGLENLNRLGQNQAKLELLPGAAQGGSIINIQNQLSKPWRGSIGVNNTGVKETGEYQVDASFLYDNLFGVNDSLVASVSSNVGKHDLPQAKSRSYSLSSSLPYGYWQFSFNNSFFEYEQTVVGQSVDFLTHGSSFNTSLSADHTVYRGQVDKLNLGLTLTRKESRNFIEDVFLDTSSRVIYVTDAMAQYVRFIPSGSVDAALHINKSVSWFDATRELANAENDFQFTKYLFDFGFNTQFQFDQQAVGYSLNLHLLYSPEVILASEGITVGGRYSVRGLTQSSLFGYQGGYIRNDFTLPFATNWPMLNQLRLQLGIDSGATNVPEFSERGTQWVAGGYLGLVLSDQRMTVSLSYARALRTPDFLATQKQEIDFSVRLSF